MSAGVRVREFGSIHFFTEHGSFGVAICLMSGVGYRLIL
jgi:hypothetical protein